jgi:N6-adenosine-specific RNA methylase IME4
MNLQSYLAPSTSKDSPQDSFIGIWITNKPSIRALILSPTGLFATWGVTLVEEWLWLKTTTSGTPVTPIDGVWRKPYEVFLLGKKIAGPESAGVTRRVIVGVPDLHSRKPCLKALLERLILREGYEALEVFARNLTAGWHSWGDQVLMFNWEGCWVDDDESVDLS